MTTTFYYLMASNMFLCEPADTALVKHWFPIHFFHGNNAEYATGFHIAENATEVLGVLLQAHLLLGIVFLLPESDFLRLMDNFNRGHDPRGPEMGRGGGTVITAYAWRQRMLREWEEEAAEDDLCDLDEVYSSAQEGDDGVSLESDTDTNMDAGSDCSDSDDDELDELYQAAILVQRDERKPSHLVGMDAAFLESVDLSICEALDVPKSSSVGSMI